MKRIFALLLVCLLIAGAAVPVLADNSQPEYVFDLAGILDTDQWYSLESQAEAISDRYGCGVYVLTVDDMAEFNYDDIEEFSQDIFDQWELGLGNNQDGILLALSMAERDYDLDAHGDTANYAFTDYGKQELASYFLPYFSEDDWEGGFAAYISQCSWYLENAQSGNPIDLGASTDEGLSVMTCIVIGLALGLLIALCSCTVMKRKLNTARKATEASAYAVPGGTSIRISNDLYTHTTVVRTKLQNESSSDGGGTSVNSGGHSHSSGKF